VIRFWFSNSEVRTSQGQAIILPHIKLRDFLRFYSQGGLVVFEHGKSLFLHHLSVGLL
jgi:hypothetical protein